MEFKIYTSWCNCFKNLFRFIINNKTLIEHDVVVEDNCHLSTRSTVNGGVTIKKNSFIGSCSVIKQNIKIGKNCFVNANLFIEKNLKDNSKILWKKIKQ